MNANDEGEWRMRLGDHCSFPAIQHVLLCSGSVYDGISRPIKHSHSEWSLHAAVYFVIITVRTCIRTFGNTPIVILCFQIFVTFAFIICIHIMHKWNLSLIQYVSVNNAMLCVEWCPLCYLYIYIYVCIAYTDLQIGGATVVAFHTNSVQLLTSWAPY